MNEARVFFAGPPGSQSAQGRLEVYDGVTLAPNGAATLGPLVHVSPTLTYAPNTFAVANLASGVTVTSGVLVVAFTIDANPNASIPALGCIGGYSASFATDTLVVPGGTAPQSRLRSDRGLVGRDRLWRRDLVRPVL